MKILHIVAGVEPGGGMAESVPALARFTCQRGHEVALATLAGATSEAALRAEAAGVRLLRFEPAWPRGFYFSWRMWRQLRAVCRVSDVVHVHGGWTFPVWWGCWCALRAGRLLVRSPRATFDPVRLRHSAWKKRLALPVERWLLRRARLVHATSAGERLDVLRQLPAKARMGGDVAVLPNGVEVAECIETIEAAAQVKSEDRRERRVIYLGRRHPLKGLDLLEQAWERAKRPGWSLTLYGAGLPGGLLQGAGKWQALAEADLLVLPSRSENFGLVVAEALAVGVPVITTKGTPWAVLQQPVNSEQLAVNSEQLVVNSEQLSVNSEQLAVNSGEHQGEAGECSAYRLPFTVYQTGTRPSTCFGRSGWWVEVSVEALAQALDEAMGMSDAQRAAMGMNGRKLVFERFRWEVVAAEMENLYNAALNTDSRQVFCKLQS